MLNQPDHMRGSSSMAVLQAGVGHYNQLTPGLVGQFYAPHRNGRLRPGAHCPGPPGRRGLVP